jgi:acetoacetyl-CoA synthetase
LNEYVTRVASGLVAAGVKPGDIVAGVLPNIPEAIVAMLATTSLGAVWTSCSPDYGAEAIIDRIGQVRPKVLFAADGYTYNGKTHDRLEVVSCVARQIDSIQQVVIVPHLNDAVDAGQVWRGIRLDQFEAAGKPGFRRMAFNAPLLILYSSGTTGRPKCIVHGTGGTLLQHRKEHLLHVDLKPEDRLFFYTTCSWMMWNWLVSGLATGATIVLYEGSPTHPGVDTLWRLAEREQVSVFGTSPKYLDALQKEGYRPADHHYLGSLRAVLSTGAPLAAEQYAYVWAAISAAVQLASMSGGTDIISCFCLGNPWLPVHPGEVQAAGLGMAVEVWNDAAAAVLDERGELVCTRAFPSMPLGFWNDAGNKKYRSAYFERFPGVWHQGDFATQSRNGGFMILGRSDAILNPGGVRIGTAEIYRQVARVEEVQECVAIGQAWGNDVRIVLFVQPSTGVVLDAELTRKIKNTIRAHATPRHVPAKVLSVPDIPRTRNGKVAESLANPESLEYFRNRPELVDESGPTCFG